MPVYKIYHTTTYEYDRTVKESVNEIKIYPYQCNEQEVLQHDISITGNPEIQTFYDYWGNKTGVFNLLPSHKELTIGSRLLVRTTAPAELDINYISGFAELEMDVKGQLRMTELITPEKIKSQQDIDAIVKTIYKNEGSVAETVQNLCNYIFTEFNYIKGITNVETTVDEILEHRSGVCQDFVHVMIGSLRSLRLGARYVSGYLRSGAKYQGAEASHAWVAVFVPDAGWLHFDPTNDLIPSDGHVTLAWGRDYSDVTPVKGVTLGGGAQKVDVAVRVDPVQPPK